MKREEKYVEGTDMNQFVVIESISHYNWNYHVGFDKDVLFAKSDDDNTTQWFLLHGSDKPFYLGESYCNDGERLCRHPYEGF